MSSITPIGLDPGITVIEASAGTGKTHLITDLVVRLVAERDIPMREIVVVTFTKAATAELKDKIRGRIRDALEALKAGETQRADLQALVTHIQAFPEAQGRLQRAQRDFDQALISTIHGFCQRMIDSEGMACGADVGLELLANTTDLLEEIVDDWLGERLRVESFARYTALTREAGFTREGLLDLAKTALRDPDIPVFPTDERWTATRFRDEADALLTRWQGAEGAALGQAYEAQRAQARPELTQRLDASGITPGEELHQGDWLAEVFIDQLKWWPPQGRPLASGLYSTNDTHMGKWAEGKAGTTPEGQAIAQAIRSIRFSPDKHIQEIEDWLAEVPGPDHPTQPKGLNKLMAAAGPDFAEASLALLTDTAVFLDYRRCMASIERTRFVHWARAELIARCQRRGLRTYHEQIQLLASPLMSPTSPQAQALTAAVGSRVRATLIDEFQDTDAQQWQIFRTLLGPWMSPGQDPRRHSDHRLFLIGDPKQAIYSFRGANLYVYLDAKTQTQETQGHLHTLSTNWRTDTGLIAGLEHLMGGKDGYFGDPRIKFTPVQPAQPCRMASSRAPLQVRFITRHPATGAAPLNSNDATHLTATAVAADVVATLREGLEIPGDDGHPRPLSPGDITVLVRNHIQGRQIDAALKSVNVRTINLSAQDVFKSDTCGHILAWLRAIHEPGRSTYVRTAATTPLIGLDGSTLAGLDADQPEALSVWEQWMGDLRDWRERFERRGFLATFGDAMARRQIQVRLLSRTDGERRVSDLHHLCELIHAGQTDGRLGLSGLITWVEQQRLTRAEDEEAVDIRLETEGGAVKIQTMHASKGLEYPVVFVPFAWRSGRLKDAAKNNLVVSNPDDPTSRLLDLQLCHREPDKAERLARAGKENLEEAIRLVYVALTRAQHRCILYTGHIQELSGSPLASMLHAPGPLTSDDRLSEAEAIVRPLTAEKSGLQEQEALWETLQAWAERAPVISQEGTLAVEVSQFNHTAQVDPWQAPISQEQDLAVRGWTRSAPDRDWRRHSYSSFVKSSSAAPSTAAEAEGLDLDQDVDEAESEPQVGITSGVPLSKFPAGATPGIVLHEVLEKMDFAWAQSDPEDEFGDLLDDVLGRAGMLNQKACLKDGLIQALLTPLGGRLEQTRLTDIPRADRLDELRFDLPIAGGDRHRRDQRPPTNGRALIQALGTAPSQGVPTDYVSRLLERDWVDLAGFLNGAIDLVMRVPQTTGPDQWYIVDYKSNRLAPRTQEWVPATTYQQAPLLEEMAHHDYHLQYHLYTLALHRFLKSRLPDYDYEQHFGGVAYMFVRGMVGPSLPHNGVVHARPCLAVVQAMDALIGGAHD